MSRTLLPNAAPIIVHIVEFIHVLVAPKFIEGLGMKHLLDDTLDHPTMHLYGAGVKVVQGGLYIYPAAWNPRNNNKYFPGAVFTNGGQVHHVLGVICTCLLKGGTIGKKWHLRLVHIVAGCITTSALYEATKATSEDKKFTAKEMFVKLIGYFVENYKAHLRMHVNEINDPAHQAMFSNMLNALDSQERQKKTLEKRMLHVIDCLFFF